jgi:hypothetical protein
MTSSILKLIFSDLLGGVWRYVKANRWTWYVIGFALVLALGYYLSASRIPALKATVEQIVKSWTTTEKVVLSTANVVITATGGVTEVELVAGVPVKVRNEGGTLHVQADIKAESNEKTKVKVATVTTSEYQESGREAGKWGARVGVEVGRSPLRLEAGVSRRIIGPFGVEVSASIPKDAASFDELRGGLSVTGRW